MKKETLTKVRKKCVSLAKKLAKFRDKNCCQKCGKVTLGHDCQGSHVIAESRDKRLSCEPINIKVLCYRCHVRWHECPTESGERFKQTFPDRRDYLSREHQRVEGSIGLRYFKEKYEELKLLCKELGLI